VRPVRATCARGSLLRRCVQPLDHFIGRIGPWGCPRNGVGVQDDVDARPFGDVREDRRELRAEFSLQSQLSALQFRLGLLTKLLELGPSARFVLNQSIALRRGQRISFGDLPYDLLELFLLGLQIASTLLPQRLNLRLPTFDCVATRCRLTVTTVGPADRTRAAPNRTRIAPAASTNSCFIVGLLPGSIVPLELPPEGNRAGAVAGTVCDIDTQHAGRAGDPYAHTSADVHVER
jgi:hypothetical protein